ncbi:hypothetical protein ACRAVF_27610 [Bradyrhizobium oligotrophicum S58]
MPPPVLVRVKRRSGTRVLRRILFAQLLGEEPDDLGVELPMERRAVEIGWRIGTDPRHADRKLGGAGREKGEMRCWYGVDLGAARKARGDACRAFRIDAIAAELRAPDLEGILMLARSAFVNPTVWAASASTAALILASCGQLRGNSPLRTCSQNGFCSVQY